MDWPHLLRRLPSDRRGNITILFAGSLTTLIGMSALAIDIGSIYLDKRRLQGVADLAVVAAAGANGSAESAARATLLANGSGKSMARAAGDVNSGDGAQLTSIVQGQYSADTSVAPENRFRAGGSSPNAVRVTLTKEVPLFFGRFLMGRATTPITVKATAARRSYAAFSLGSRLAAVNGGLPGALLSGLAGTELNLTAMDYNALAGADIDLLSFSQALRTQARLNAVTFADTLAAGVTLPQALNALADASGGAAATSLRALALRVPGTTIRLSAIIDPGPLGQESHPDPNHPVKVDSYSIVREMLMLAGNHRQVVMNTGLNVPGLASTTIRLAIGERPAQSPWLAIATDGGVTVRTAQTRVYLDARLEGAATLGLLSLRLPLYAELAQAQASLDSVQCASGLNQGSVSVNVTPAIGAVSIADINTANFDNFQTPLLLDPAMIARAPLVQVTGQATTQLGGVTAQRVSFSDSDIAAGRIRTVSTGDLAQGLTASLLEHADLRAEALGMGFNLGVIVKPVGAALTPVAPTIDMLLDQVTGLLGVNLGQADVRVNGVRCGKAVLVG
jgi:uncharacterized membrane protein